MGSWSRRRLHLLPLYATNLAAFSRSCNRWRWIIHFLTIHISRIGLQRSRLTVMRNEEHELRFGWLPVYCRGSGLFFINPHI
jgi:hypothetical protein